jgi:diguanylate cyclase (GGDEF)-like protein
MPQSSLKNWINIRLVIVLIMMMLCGAASSFILMGWIFSDFEQRRTQNELKRAMVLLERDGQAFSASAGDYGFWEDTYYFVNAINPTYWSHFTPNLMINNQMDWVLILDRDGQPFDARILKKHLVLPMSTIEITSFTTTAQQAMHERCEQKGQMIVWQDKQPALMVYAPIVESLGRSPIQGCVVFGRWINQVYRQQVKDLTGVRLQLSPLQGDSAMLASTPQRATMIAKDLQVVLYADIANVLDDEKWMAIGVLLANILFLIMVLICVLSAIMDRKIINRILLFSRLADRYRRHHDANVVWPTTGGDEIDNLGNALNELVAKVEYQIRDVEFDAEHDPLTGIGNRRYLLKALADATKTYEANLSATHPTTSITGCLILIDLDGFKLINDHLGHQVGDATLITVAQRIVEDLRSDDIVVRLGGDEFAVFMPHTISQDAMQTAQRLCEKIAQPLAYEKTMSYVTASIGVVALGALSTPIELLRHADLAMYEAKRLGKNQAVLFDTEIYQAFTRRVEIEKALRLALDHGHLETWFQPIVEAHDYRVTGLEALVRWRWNDVYVRPDEFIPIAEEAGLIVQLGSAVLRSACQTLRRLYDAGYTLSCSVNVSIRQLDHKDLLSEVPYLLSHYRLDAGVVHLELTESMLEDREDELQKTLYALKALGLHLHLDDFGTGYSSLSRLQQLPLCAIKIDRSFVAPLQRNEVTLVRAIVEMAKNLNLEVIAEGVETVLQRDLLQEIGVNKMQGYLFARPMPEVDLMVWLQAHHQQS